MLAEPGFFFHMKDIKLIKNVFFVKVHNSLYQVNKADTKQKFYVTIQIQLGNLER